MVLASVTVAVSQISEPIKLATSLVGKDARRLRYIEGTLPRGKGQAHAVLTRRMHIVRRPGAFPAQKDDVAGREAEFVQRIGGVGLGEDQPRRCHSSSKRRPVIVPRQLRILPVVHARAPQFAVIEQKPAGLDDVQGQIETGAEPHDRPRILWNIGFKKGD